MAERERPFCFSMDDLEITGAVLSYGLENAPQRAGDRVPGVWVTHVPTGKQVISTQMPTRDENIAVALRRLDRSIRRGQGR